ncbi:MAG: hypothetical protein J6126_06140 [Clostridia bacterium]|nr:hypothetical protein [Clostridia bacterium]
MRILSFDIESCTGSPYDGSLCSFGYYLAEDGEKISSDDILVNPLPRRFTLGGYGKEPVLKLAYPIGTFRHQPRFNERFSAIKGVFEQADLVIGYALQNDLRYLNNACDVFSLPRIEFSFLDVQLVVGLVIPELKAAGLKAVADRFGIGYLEHRSDEDARVTYLIFEKTLELYGGTLKALMREKGLVLGVNRKDGHVGCYSESLLKERIASGSRAVKKIIIHYFAECAKALPRRGNSLLKKAVGISESVYAGDVSLARRILATIFAEGGVYEQSPFGCNIYIIGSGDDRSEKAEKVNRRKCRIMTADEFSDSFGGLADMEADELDALIEYAARLSPDVKPDPPTSAKNKK